MKTTKLKRCSACMFYDERGKTRGKCNKDMRTYLHSKTGKHVRCLSPNVRSSWVCIDFLCYEDNKYSKAEQLLYAPALPKPEPVGYGTEYFTGIY